MSRKMRELGEEVRERLMRTGDEFAAALKAQGKRQRDKLLEIVEQTRNLDSVTDFDLDRTIDLNDHSQRELIEDLFGDAGVGDLPANMTYRDLFERYFPDAEAGNVHHAIEQQVLRRKPFTDLFTVDEINSIENLRGIPGEINSPVHLSAIRRMWNQFYDVHGSNALPENQLSPSELRQAFLDYATLIDDSFGDLFDPPIR